MLPGRTDRSVRARKSWGQACLPPPNPTTHARPGQSLPFAHGAAVLTLAAHRHRWSPSPHGGPPPQRVWLNGPGQGRGLPLLKKAALGFRGGEQLRCKLPPPTSFPSAIPRSPGELGATCYGCPVSTSTETASKVDSLSQKYGEVASSFEGESNNKPPSILVIKQRLERQPPSSSL